MMRETPTDARCEQAATGRRDDRVSQYHDAQRAWAATRQR